MPKLLCNVCRAPMKRSRQDGGLVHDQTLRELVVTRDEAQRVRINARYYGQLTDKENPFTALHQPTRS